MSLCTPRQVLQEMVKSAMANPETPPEGMSHLRQMFQRLLERGMLDFAMSAQSIEDLLDEITDDILTPEPEPTYRTEPVN